MVNAITMPVWMVSGALGLGVSLLSVEMSYRLTGGNESVGMYDGGSTLRGKVEDIDLSNKT